MHHRLHSTLQQAPSCRPSMVGKLCSFQITRQRCGHTIMSAEIRGHTATAPPDPCDSVSHGLELPLRGSAMDNSATRQLLRRSCMAKSVSLRFPEPALRDRRWQPQHSSTISTLRQVHDRAPPHAPPPHAARARYTRCTVYCYQPLATLSMTGPARPTVILPTTLSTASARWRIWAYD